jgi:hypothetical protein
MVFVIGDDPSIIPDAPKTTKKRARGVHPPPKRSDIVDWLWHAATLFDELWDVSGQTDGELRILHYRLKTEVMEGMKVAFPNHSCQFSKFHFCLHLCDEIRFFGSLRLIDTR